ncbi:ATP-dependent RNA helicase HrpA [Citrobacter braakii]|nr:ATP-dependent RNA helicase HrpA [Citrobacter braakii]
MTEQQKLTFNMLQQQLDSLMLRDRQRFARRLQGVKKVKNPDAQQAIYQEMAKEIDHAAGKVVLRGSRASGHQLPGKPARQSEKTGYSGSDPR